MTESLTSQAQRSPQTPKRKRISLVPPVYTTASFAFEPRISESDDERSPHSKVVQKFRGLAIQGGGGSGGGGGGATASSPERQQQQHSRFAQQRQQYQRERQTSPARRLAPLYPDGIVDHVAQDGAVAAAAAGSNNDQAVVQSVEVADHECYVDDGADEAALTMRKRRRAPDVTMRDADGPTLGVVHEASANNTPETTLPEPDLALLSPVRGGGDAGGASHAGGADDDEMPPLLQRSYPSINRLSDSRSRGGGGAGGSARHHRRRVGTPPVSHKRVAAALAGIVSGASSSRGYIEEVEEEEDEEDDDDGIVEPERAAQTWQNDEITMYDPDDEDDDGTGINGIGFKPTAAVAYARVMKRKQQLTEYRKRQESEARARRSQQRRSRRSPGVAAGAAASSSSSAAAQAARKVRFLDASPAVVASM